MRELVAGLPVLQEPSPLKWPVILWEQGGYDGWTPAEIALWLERGLVPHVRLHEKDLTLAKMIQEAGAPVIAIDKLGFSFPHNRWPYTEASEEEVWKHEYSVAIAIPPQWKELPNPGRFSGWREGAEQFRQKLLRFREAGITLDALWLDYEGEPSTASYRASLYSDNSRDVLPPEAMRNEETFDAYRRQLWISLMSSYFASSVREVYPDVSVTNWAYYLSSPEYPALRWNNQKQPPVGVNLFTATNPSAYGNTVYWETAWDEGTATNRANVDLFYQDLLLRQVSADARNRQAMAPWLNAVVWVARWVPDSQQEGLPIISRDAYREVLRHLIMRGIDAIEVFNPTWQSRHSMAIAEVEDVMQIVREMSPYEALIKQGEPMNFDLMSTEGDKKDLLWSGVKLEDRALIRYRTYSMNEEFITFEPWEGHLVALPMAEQGATCLLRLSGNAIEIENIEQ